MEFFPDFFKLPEDWKDFFYDQEMEELILKTLSNLPLGNALQFYPSGENIFRCFYLTKFKDVRVVLLGQEPYNDGSATGLCFDVKQGYLLSQSIQNIYKELESESYYPTKDGCLEGWAKQGVLLLNTTLTVPARVGGDSHSEIWAPFMEKVFKKLAEKEGVIWVLLGHSKLKKMIPGHHTIIEVDHPSASTFLGSGVFKKVNNVLYKTGRDKIAW